MKFLKLLVCFILISNVVFGQYSITDNKGYVFPTSPTRDGLVAEYLNGNWLLNGNRCAVWYDSVGNCNATQTVGASQPLVSNGMLEFNDGISQLCTSNSAYNQCKAVGKITIVIRYEDASQNQGSFRFFYGQDVYGNFITGAYSTPKFGFCLGGNWESISTMAGLPICPSRKTVAWMIDSGVSVSGYDNEKIVTKATTYPMPTCPSITMGGGVAAGFCYSVARFYDVRIYNRILSLSELNAIRDSE